MKLINCVFLILLLAIAPLAPAQDFNGRHKRFTIKNGLSDDAVTALIKDTDGFLWIGTREGLNRYDGDKFLQVYSRSDRKGLPSDVVTALELLDKDHIAVGTANGLSILHTKTMQCRNVSFPYYKNWERHGSSVIDLLYDKKNKELWVGTGLGVYVLDSNYKVQRSLMCSEESMKTSGGYFVTRFFIGPGNEIFFLNKGLKLCYANFKERRTEDADRKIPGLPVNRLAAGGYDCIGVKRQGAVTTFTLSVRSQMDAPSYVVWYNGENGAVEQFPVRSSGRHIIEGVTFPPDQRLFNAYPLNDSSLIVNPYYDYPKLFGKNTGTLKPLSEQPLYFSSWPDGLGAVYLRDGPDFWIGTGKGLLQLSGGASYVQQLKELNRLALLSPGTIFISDAVYQSNKLFLAATSFGLYSFDTLTKRTALHFPPDQGFATQNVTQSLLAFDKDNLWVMTAYGALNFHVPDGRFSLINKKGKDPALDGGSNQVFRDSKGLVWIGFGKGLACYDPVTDSFTNYYNEKNGGLLPVQAANYIAEDHASNLWISNPSGLIQWIRKERRFVKIAVTRNGIDYSRSSTLVSDKKQGLYFASRGALVHYDIPSGNFSVYTIHDGLASGEIADIVADKKGNAWIATIKGLNYFDAARHSFFKFSKEDGLLEDVIGCVKILDSNTNKLLVGFTNSACIFYPEQYLEQQSAPKNVITGITVNNLPVDRYSERSFPFYRNNLGFEFTGINFDEGQLNRYAFKLEGYDTGWQQAGLRKYTSYINLPPGQYTFKVKSANRQNIWNDEPAIFSFTIRPPFWKTMPFYIAVAIIALGLLFLAFYLQRKKIVKRETEKRRLSTIMSELRMKALRSQLNPHFIFNALNSIQYFIMENNTQEAAKYLSRFAKLFRLVLENSEESFIPLQKELEWLKHYIDIESLRFHNKFEYNITVDSAIDTWQTLIPSMLIQPHIENAIIHGLLMVPGNGKLLISFTAITDKLVQCAIQDNGIGRVAAGKIKEQKRQTHESKAMGIIEKRMEILKSRYGLESTFAIEDLYDEYNKPAGTRITLMIPVAEKNHLADEL